MRIYKDGHDYRFLISFAGKYLPHDYCIASPLGESEGESLTLEYQFYKINVPHIEANLFGPAFIEVSISIINSLFIFFYGSDCLSGMVL